MKFSLLSNYSSFRKLNVFYEFVAFNISLRIQLTEESKERKDKYRRSDQVLESESKY